MTVPEDVDARTPRQVADDHEEVKWQYEVAGLYHRDPSPKQVKAGLPQDGSVKIRALLWKLRNGFRE